MAINKKKRFRIKRKSLRTELNRTKNKARDYIYYERDTQTSDRDTSRNVSVVTHT